MNLLTVKLFGEIEFWFALIKVVAIIALVGLGVVLLVGRFTTPTGETVSLTHLWNHGGFFPTGASGFFQGFQIAIFAFVGIELVGTTAAETSNPTRTLPKAINSIPIRIVVFYLCALATIMSVTPWDQVNPEVSPFVNVFSLVGLTSAASLMNFVVLTSAASSCNSGLYSTSRMLFGLAHKGMAPRAAGQLSRRMVPLWGLITSVILILVTVVILMLNQSAMEAFTFVTTISSVLFIFVWGLILASYLVYRRRYPDAHSTSIYPMPGGRISAWACLVFFGFALVLLTFAEDTRRAIAVTPVWFIMLGATWLLTKGRSHRDDSTTTQITDD